jgi:signal transduction histidine kinase
MMVNSACNQSNGPTGQMSFPGEGTRAEAAMSAMSASIAHEVNQPLAAIVANASAGLRWLERSAPDLDEARAALARIADEGLRASQLIASVRAMFSNREMTVGDVDLEALIGDVLASIRADAARKGVVVRQAVESGLPAVRGDAVRLRQVVQNLVGNAVEAMQSVPDRVLSVTLSAAGPAQVRLAVTDTGPGVPAQVQARIFDAFYTTKTGGMGLGLALCRSIVGAHRGRLVLEPKASRGARFVVTLPVGEAQLVSAALI